VLPKFNISRFEERIYEIIPGFLTWLSFILPIILIFSVPRFISYVIILFELYWFFRSLNISYHLVVAYRKLKKGMKVNWYKKLKNSSFDYEKIVHVIMIPALNESFEVLNSSIKAAAESAYNIKKIWLVLTAEERGGEEMKNTVLRLEEKYKNSFGKFIAIIHPDGIVGEAKAKGANITYAAKKVEEMLKKENKNLSEVLLSSIDSDSAISKNLLAHFTYKFFTTENRQRKLFQFIPMYHNNFWEAPPLSRIIATGCAFWSMIESTRQTRFRTFACYGMTFQNLKDSEYWDITSIIEDGIQYWRNIFAQKDSVGLVEPVYSKVYMDAVMDDTLIGTLKAQYKQLRRWAWGASDLAFIMPRFTRMKCFSFKDKFMYVARLIENHFTWATVPLLLLCSGQISVLNANFSETVLGSNLPVVTSWILTIMLSGMTIAIFISTMLLPDKNKFEWKHKPFLSHFYHIISWVLVPLITIFYGALPAIHSQTQLMFGKKMETFVVTVKKRKMKK